MLSSLNFRFTCTVTVNEKALAEFLQEEYENTVENITFIDTYPRKKQYTLDLLEHCSTRVFKLMQQELQ
jgi:hypothetical protein